MQLLDQRDRGGTIRRLTDDVESAVRAKRTHQTVEHQRMVVGDDDSQPRRRPGRAAGRPLWGGCGS